MDGPVFTVLSLFDFLFFCFFRYFGLFRAVGQGRELVFTHFQGGFEFGDPLGFVFKYTETCFAKRSRYLIP